MAGVKLQGADRNIQGCDCVLHIIHMGLKNGIELVIILVFLDGSPQHAGESF